MTKWKVSTLLSFLQIINFFCNEFKRMFWRQFFHSTNPTSWSSRTNLNFALPCLKRKHTHFFMLNLAVLSHLPLLNRSCRRAYREKANRCVLSSFHLSLHSICQNAGKLVKSKCLAVLLFCHFLFVCDCCFFHTLFLVSGTGRFGLFCTPLASWLVDEGHTDNGLVFLFRSETSERESERAELLFYAKLSPKRQSKPAKSSRPCQGSGLAWIRSFWRIVLTYDETSTKTSNNWRQSEPIIWRRRGPGPGRADESTVLGWPNCFFFFSYQTHTHTYEPEKATAGQSAKAALLLRGKAENNPLNKNIILHTFLPAGFWSREAANLIS